MKLPIFFLSCASVFCITASAFAAPPGVAPAHKGPKPYNQVHMEAALRDLAAAKKELQSANHDKEDMRIKAIGLVDQATAAVNQGIIDAGGEAAH